MSGQSIYDSWQIDTNGEAIRPVANRRILLGGAVDDNGTTLQVKGVNAIAVVSPGDAETTILRGDGSATIGLVDLNADGSIAVLAIGTGGVAADPSLAIKALGPSSFDNGAILMDGSGTSTAISSGANGTTTAIVGQDPGGTLNGIMAYNPTGNVYLVVGADNNNCFIFGWQSGVATASTYGYSAALQFDAAYIALQAHGGSVFVGTTTDDMSGAVLQVAGNVHVTDSVVIDSGVSVQFISDPTPKQSIDVINRKLTESDGSTDMFDWSTAGTLDCKTNKLSNVVDPSSAQDAATKAYVDSGLSGKQASGTYVTSVGVTAPVASTGGTTPTISMAASTNSVNGYLTSADHTTFAAKASLITNVALTTQGADISATTLTSTAGQYLLSYVIEDTSLDLTAGAVTLTFTWTDDAGSTSSASTPLVLTALGRTSGVISLVLASGNIQYAVSHTGIFGTAKFALKIGAVKVG